MEVRENDITAG